MKLINCDIKTNFAIQESKIIESVTNRIKKIWDAKYEKANIKEITTKLKYLVQMNNFFIYRQLKNHGNMFDGTLGNYTCNEY